jgi:hypothetical protein
MRRRTALPVCGDREDAPGRLLMKLQARDRTQLVIIACETGLITPGGG